MKQRSQMAEQNTKLGEVVGNLNNRFKELKLVKEFQVTAEGTYVDDLDFERDIKSFVDERKVGWVERMNELQSTFSQVEKQIAESELLKR